jgi:hypothetical protein
MQLVGLAVFGYKLTEWQREDSIIEQLKCAYGRERVWGEERQPFTKERQGERVCETE